MRHEFMRLNASWTLNFGTAFKGGVQSEINWVAIKLLQSYSMFGGNFDIQWFLFSIKYNPKKMIFPHLKKEMSAFHLTVTHILMI